MSQRLGPVFVALFPQEKLDNLVSNFSRCSASHTIETSFNDKKGDSSSIAPRIQPQLMIQSWTTELFECGRLTVEAISGPITDSRKMAPSKALQSMCSNPDSTCATKVVMWKKKAFAPQEWTIFKYIWEGMSSAI